MSTGSGTGWPAGGVPPEAGVPAPVTVVVVKTLDGLRAALARSMGLYYSGTVTSGGANFFRDTDSLVRFTVEDVLAGAVVYLPRQAASDEMPIGQWRRIIAWDALQQMVTLEYPFAGSVQPDTAYEIYRALDMNQWMQAINGAINKAWPDIWERVETEIQVGRGLEYQLPGDVKNVLEVHSESSAYWSGYGRSLIPPSLWRMNHAARGQGQTEIPMLVLHHVLPGAGWKLHVAYQRQFAELEDGLGLTSLDTGFLMDQGRALAYQMLAGETQGEAQASTWFQSMIYWQERADARRQGLAGNLLGIPAIIQKGSK